MDHTHLGGAGRPGGYCGPQLDIDSRMTTIIHYDMGGRRMHWKISAHSLDDDVQTLQEHLLEWFGPDATFVSADYVENGVTYPYHE